MGALIVLLCSIAFGSALFHWLALIWAQILDVLPIVFFQVVYLWGYLRYIIQINCLVQAIAVCGFVLSILFLAQFSHLLNESLVYIPALIVLVLLGGYQRASIKGCRNSLLWAAVLFVVSLMFRSIDMEICSLFPVGTHFLWHLCNGGVLYLSMKGFLSAMLSKGEEVG